MDFNEYKIIQGYGQFFNKRYELLQKYGYYEKENNEIVLKTSWYPVCCGTKEFCEQALEKRIA